MVNIAVRDNSGNAVILKTTDDGTGLQIPQSVIVLPLPIGTNSLGRVGVQVASADVSVSNPVPVNVITGDYPLGAVPVAISSGNAANATATATLLGASGKTTYITGFSVTGSGSTGALIVQVTITGTLNTLTYIYGFALGVAVMNNRLDIQFGTAVPASAANTAIVVTCPAGGSGNTNNSVVATGYQL